jgi:hypothetical protein
MPTQGNSETEVHCNVIQNGDDQALVLSKTENWVADKSAAVMCRNPVDLTEWQ